MFGNRKSIVRSRIAESRCLQLTTRRLARPATVIATTTFASVQHARQSASHLHWLTVALALAASLIFVLTDSDGGRSSTTFGFKCQLKSPQPWDSRGWFDGESPR